MLSCDALTNIIPLQWNSIAITGFWCPFKMAISYNVSILHSLIVVSEEALANIDPLWLNAIAFIESLWSYNDAIIA